MNCRRKRHWAQLCLAAILISVGGFLIGTSSAELYRLRSFIQASCAIGGYQADTWRLSSDPPEVPTCQTHQCGFYVSARTGTDTFMISDFMPRYEPSYHSE